MIISCVRCSNLGLRFIGNGKLTGVSSKNKTSEVEILRQKSIDIEISKKKKRASVKAKMLTKDEKREKHEKLMKSQQEAKERVKAEKLLDRKLKLRKQIKLEIMRKNKES